MAKKNKKQKQMTDNIHFPKATTIEWIVFCSMVDRRKAFSLIFSQDRCQRSSPSWISDTPRAGFEPAQNLSSCLVEWSCTAAITATPRRHICSLLLRSRYAEKTIVRADVKKWRYIFRVINAFDVKSLGKTLLTVRCLLDCQKILKKKRHKIKKMLLEQTVSRA